MEEEGESISIEQQPEAVEEGAGAARLPGSRRVEESELFVFDSVHQTYCFAPQRRERKLSGEDQQEDAKRPKPPEKEDGQQAGQAEKSAWSGAGGY